MEPLRGKIRPYAWGSATVLAQLDGRPVPSAGPEAELWLGAHPDDPSTVDRPTGTVSLLDVIDGDPVGVLGQPVLDEFGPRLPYLLKVLAAAEPLSLQAHPDSERARERYAAGDPHYTDPYHKPELLVAVDEFEALCGFRPLAESAKALAALDLPELAPVLSLVDGPGAGSDRLRAVVTALLGWPESDRAALVSRVVGAGAGRVVRELARRYPADLGVVVALLLNHVTLAPGEGIWMPAGNLHTYLHGTGVEILAASDNVLRGGLTPKRVNVPELLRVLRFEVRSDPVVRPVAVARGVRTWPVPVRDFALHEVTVGAGARRVELDVSGPRVALCLAGEVTVDDGGGLVVLSRGRSAFGAARQHQPLSVSGEGIVYIATPGGAINT